MKKSYFVMNTKSAVFLSRYLSDTSSAIVLLKIQIICFIDKSFYVINVAVYSG